MYLRGKWAHLVVGPCEGWATVGYQTQKKPPTRRLGPDLIANLPNKVIIFKKIYSINIQPLKQIGILRN